MFGGRAGWSGRVDGGDGGNGGGMVVVLPGAAGVGAIWGSGGADVGSGAVDGGVVGGEVPLDPAADDEAGAENRVEGAVEGVGEVHRRGDAKKGHNVKDNHSGDLDAVEVNGRM